MLQIGGERIFLTEVSLVEAILLEFYSLVKSILEQEQDA